MYVPNTVPSNITEMTDFLLLGVEKKIFDKVICDSEKIECIQNDNVVLEVIFDSVNNIFAFYPKYKNLINSDEHHTGRFYPYSNSTPTNLGAYANCMICEKGIVFCSQTNRLSGTYNFYAVCIGKGDKDQTVIITSYFPSGYPVYPLLQQVVISFFPNTFEDNTNLSIFNAGNSQYCDLTNSDRTILSEIPIVGERGTTEKVNGIYFRKAVQFPDNGQQIIGNRKYGCLSFFAVLDE